MIGGFKEAGNEGQIEIPSERIDNKDIRFPDDSGEDYKFEDGIDFKDIEFPDDSGEEYEFEDRIDYKDIEFPDDPGEGYELGEATDRKDIVSHEEQQESEKDYKNDLSSEDSKDGQNPEDKKESDVGNDSNNNHENDDPDSDIDKDEIKDKIEEVVKSPEKIRELMEKHPEKAEAWGKLIESIKEAQEVLNDPDASDAEKAAAGRKINANMSQLKGQLFETIVKDVLSESGFEVETEQHMVEGESGGTKPDIVAKNNTDKPITVFGVTIQPGDTLSIECKCGRANYIENQLKTHIPNQLSGQEGTRVLLTTSDVSDTSDGLAQDVCNKYGANLSNVDVSVTEFEKAIKEAMFL